MRHSDYFKNPELFIPSRFLDDTYHHRFLPFLSGPEMCIGNKFAMLEMKLIVSVILSHCSLELSEKPEFFTGSQGLTYHMKTPLYLRDMNYCSSES